MIKRVKLFTNGAPVSDTLAIEVKKKFMEHGFSVVEDGDFDLAIAIGGDGSFLKMVKKNDFNSDVYYVGINTGHLGFLQEVKIEEVDKLIGEISNQEYKIDEIGIQETTVTHKDGTTNFDSLNEIVLRDKYLNLLKTDVLIDNDFLESYTGDGIMLATSTGSTAYNLSYGGSIVFPNFSTLQITSMAPINSKVYKSMINSIIVPSKKVIMLKPENKEILLTVDGVNYGFENVEKIESTIDDKSIKCLRFSHYNFPQKINDKLLK